MENPAFKNERIRPERFAPVLKKWRKLLADYSVIPDPELADSVTKLAAQNASEAEIARYVDSMYRQLEKVEDEEEYIKNHGPLNAYLAEMFARSEE